MAHCPRFPCITYLLHIQALISGVHKKSDNAGRVLFPSGNWSAGLLSTYVERPFLDRTALVNCLEYTLSLNSSINIKGIVLGSSIQTDEEKSNGSGIWDNISYATADNRWSYNMTLIHFDDRVDINDMGYMQRNDFEMMMIRGQYNQLKGPGFKGSCENNDKFLRS